MEPTAHLLPRGDSGGGSLSLAEALEEHCEAVYLDLLEYYDFDLVAWMAGEKRGRPSVILAMLRDLPEGSRLQAVTYGQRDAPEGDDSESVDWYIERRRWGLPERQLMAAQLNMLGELRKYVPSWKDNKGPDWEPVGPPEWRGVTEQTEKKKGQATVEDVMAVFGWVST